MEKEFARAVEGLSHLLNTYFVVKEKNSPRSMKIEAYNHLHIDVQYVR